MRRLAAVFLFVVAGVLAAVAWAGGGGGTTASAVSGGHLTPLQQKLMSGFASRALDKRAATGPAARLRGMRRLSAAAAGSTTETGCPANRGANVRVNQNCLNLTDPDLQGRGQAQNETSIAQDPNDPAHLVSSQNDYRRGDGNCYSGYSGDSGGTWTDSTPPMGFTRGDAFGGVARQYWHAGGDTSVAWDTKGNAYLSCQMFMRGAGTSNNPDLSSAFYVFRSTQSRGASWNFPARPVVEFNDVAGNGEVLLDKQLMTIDTTKGSPFQDRIYVTWTLFDADGTSYLFGAYSRDYGEHFSTPKLVSRDSALCSNPIGVPTPKGRCNTNQFSQPFTGPDGALYVVWANYNVTGVRPGEGDDQGGGDGLRAGAAIDNKAQILLAKSTDGGNSFSAPRKVSDFYELPDCLTYQNDDPGRACVPEKGETSNSIFRASNYPVGAVDPRHASRVVVTVASYINRHSKESNGCVPQGYNPDTFQALYDGVKTPGACNNDIVISRSTNGGATFTGGTTNVRSLPATKTGGADRADQFWQWAAINPSGRLAVSYYDRGYGDDETTGFSDISLSGSRNTTDFATTRVTTSSMPPPTQFEGTFFGDYSGLSAGSDVAHPFWMDTRDPDLFVCRDSAGKVTQPPSVCTAGADQAAVANDQNVYTRGLALPLP
ncbi:MAG: exo-alpha-sialidase [Solirubrobacteraceae bacterium]